MRATRAWTAALAGSSAPTSSGSGTSGRQVADRGWTGFEMNSPLTAPDWSSCDDVVDELGGSVPRQLELELSKLRGRLPGAE